MMKNNNQKKFNNNKKQKVEIPDEDLDLIDEKENFEDFYEEGEEESSHGEDEVVSENEIDEEEAFGDEEEEEQAEAGEEAEAEEEVEDNLHSKSGSKMVDVAHMNVDMAEVNLRIQGIIDILSDFKNKKEEDKTRNDTMSELKKLLMIYYDYNEDIMSLIMYLFPPNEAVEFLESNNTQRVMTIRTNSIKTKRRELAKSLIQRGVNLDPLAEWTKVGLKVYDSQVPVGATPEYLAGHYMLQAGSSFLPVMALQPQENEKILDMSAAPGGKTTYIAQLMKNTGVLVANDLKKERLKSLFFNIQRLGIKNTIITNYDGRKIVKAFNSFDRVLLDAPCSGLGVISKDQSIKLNRTYKDIIEITRVQKELLLAAIDSCTYKSKTGGIIVYSTCSISVEENEWVVDYALKNRYVKLVDTGTDFLFIYLYFRTHYWRRRTH
jgi:ribosomal RNA methyltransferase Nop2